MIIKYSQSFLNKLEDLFSETDYTLRYEKGNFKPGHCLIRDSRVAVINKYYPLEGKINALVELIRSIEIRTDRLSEKNQKLFEELSQMEARI
jgi:predicted nuclease with TOPRIM domain